MIEIVLKENKVIETGRYAGFYNSLDFRFPENYIGSHCIKNELNGKYETGLDKYSIFVKSCKTEKDRKEMIDKLDAKRKELELSTGINLDQDTEEGALFWRDYVIETESSSMIITDSPLDQLKFQVIKGNSMYAGFFIAYNEEDLESDMTGDKDFYIENIEYKEEVKASKKIQRSKIDATLLDLYLNDNKRMNDVAVMLLPNSLGISPVSNKDTVFNSIHKYLDGEYSMSKDESSTIKRYRDTQDVLNLSKKELDLIVTVTKAINYNIIVKNSMGKYINVMQPERVYGTTKEEIIAFMKRPENQDDLGLGKDSDFSYSIKSSIKSKEQLFNK